MRSSKIAAAFVVGCTVLALAGALVTLVATPFQPATVVVLALVILVVIGSSVVGARSRRWLSNPYW